MQHIYIPETKNLKIQHIYIPETKNLKMQHWLLVGLENSGYLSAHTKIDFLLITFL